MKPRKATALVEITYWVCAQPDHRHRTKDVAAACLAKYKRAKARTNNHWTKGKMLDVCESAVRGATYVEIGEALNVKKERVRQIVDKALRMMVHPSRLDEPFPEGARDSIKAVREHSDFWLRRIAKFRENEA